MDKNIMNNNIINMNVDFLKDLINYSYIDFFEKQRQLFYLSNVRALEYQYKDQNYIKYDIYYHRMLGYYLRGQNIDFDEKRLPYITFVGAAQMFGRYCQKSFVELLDEKLRKNNIRCLNLGIGGAGPKTFLKKEFLDIINNSKLCILQIMSARSCENSFMDNDGNVDYRDSEGNYHFMNNVWTEILKLDEDIVRKLIKECQNNWLKYYEMLFTKIKVPIVLLFIGKKYPIDDDEILVTKDNVGDLFDKFPQFVTREMIDKIKDKANSYVEYVKLDKRANILYSLNERNKKMVDHYYPNPDMHGELCDILMDKIYKI